MIEFDLSLSRAGHNSGDGFRLVMAGRIDDGEFLTLFGPSGVGKSTLLRLIAGLEKPSAGTLKVDGETWCDAARGMHKPPQQRSVGFVFQDYALFPTMTVSDNVRYAAGRGESAWVGELLELTRLSALAERKPHELSGGQQQRVALARALARRPRLLLLDEPLSALDLSLRLMLQQELQELHQRFGLTTILVSHDLSEVFRLSHRVMVCEHGRIVRHGHPRDVFIGQAPSRDRLSLSGELLAKRRSDVVWILTLLVGQDIVEVIATDEEADALEPGMRLAISTRAFSPLLMPTGG
ncbi:ATP-binding cassette domain-containing protein [Crenobacter sp. SG2305]|uniref:ABC transporter ATP-binding protein n=1 Tax=Crenobacter oryzisoli TaxID=3056844 RepID=UPI0025AA7FE6|nr:ATP-binding cassette domain-containing protein [Crenobacter sp. SG2305]MDN0084925.1 ATP-binding cassette domain-containing protein [Crenobacter sp. SG2305]